MVEYLNANRSICVASAMSISPDIDVVDDSITDQLVELLDKVGNAKHVHV